jgi:hypothetical protein
VKRWFHTWTEGDDQQVFECKQSGSVHERDQDVSTVMRIP